MSAHPVLEKLLADCINTIMLFQILLCLAKLLGNGYAITAVVGKREVMENAAQNTFISSTFWTEKIGSAAAISNFRCYGGFKILEINR